MIFNELHPIFIFNLNSVLNVKKKEKKKRVIFVSQINFELHNKKALFYGKYNFVFSNNFKIRPFKIQ